MKQQDEELLLLLCSGDLNEQEKSLLEKRMEEDPVFLEQALELQHLGWLFSTSLERKYDDSMALDLRTHVMRIIEAESDTLVAQRVHNIIQQEAKKKSPHARRHSKRRNTIRRTSQTWWRGLSALAAALLLAAGIGSYIYYGDQHTEAPASQAPIANLGIEVLELRGEAYTLDTPNEALQAGKYYTLEGIELSQGGYLKAKLNDGSTIALRDATRLTYKHEAGHAFKLEGGTIIADVTPQNDAFTIQTLGATVKVIGTVFEVTHTREQTYVGVERGKVQITNNTGDTRDLTAGNGLNISDEGSFGFAPSLAKFERTISYEHPLGAWTSGVWEHDPDAPFGGYIRSLEENRYGIRYALVSDNYYAPNPIIYFTSGQIVEITYRANSAGSFTFQLVPARSINLRPEYIINIPASDVGQWKTISIPISQFNNFSPEIHNLEICRLLLIGSVDIAEFDISRIQITVQ